MPFAIPALLSGISGLAGGLNNRPGTTTSTQTGTIGDTGSQTSTPTFTPQQQQLSDSVVGGYEDQLNSDPNLSGYQASGLSQINSGNDSRQKAVSNILASRGLSFSPAAGAALGAAKNQGITQSVDFANSIPLLAKQMRLNTLGQAGGFFNNMAHGQTGTYNNTRTLNTTSKTTTPGNILGGALSGAGGMLAYLYGKGAFGGNKNSSGGMGPAASLIPGLFGGGFGGGGNDNSIPLDSSGPTSGGFPLGTPGTFDSSQFPNTPGGGDFGDMGDIFGGG